jgi:hypothetical protein
LLEKLKKGIELKAHEENDLLNLPQSYMICYLNLFHDAIDKLNEAKPFLKAYNQKVYQNYKEAMRILRKIQYN